MNENTPSPSDESERQRIIDEINAEVDAEMAATAGERALEADRLSQLVVDHVQKHRVVLVAKRRMLLRPDEYGLVDRDAWQRELDYFMDRVLRTHLDKVNPDLSWAIFTHKESYDAVGPNELRQSMTALVDATIDVADEEDRASGIEAESLSPGAFEQFCADELQAAGWDAVVMGGTGDQGVDVVAKCGDKLGVFQCKHYSEAVGNAAVQEVHTGRTIYGAMFAVVVSSSTFTPAARAAAAQTGVRLVHYSELRSMTPQSIAQ